MNKRQKKKLKNRAGFFHYKDYKLRVKLLYDMFSQVVNHQAPYVFKQVMFDYAKNMLFTKPPKKICDRNLKYKPFLTNCVGMSFGKYADIANEHILGGSAIEYPSSATIDLRKAVGRYGNMSIKDVEETPSEPIHLGPIDLGPTNGERIEEHLDDLIDQRKRFAGNSCEAMGMAVD